MAEPEKIVVVEWNDEPRQNAEPASRVSNVHLVIVAAGASILLAAGVTMGLLMGVGIGTVNCQGTFKEMRGIHADVEDLKKWHKLDH
ncbi:MAG: hypothetical protein V3W44_08695 [Dehalococcoidales bacterium]